MRCSSPEYAWARVPKNAPWGTWEQPIAVLPGLKRGALPDSGRIGTSRARVVALKKSVVPGIDKYTPQGYTTGGTGCRIWALFGYKTTMTSLRNNRSYLALTLLLAVLVSMVGPVAPAFGCDATPGFGTEASQANAVASGSCHATKMAGPCCCTSKAQAPAVSTQDAAGESSGCDCTMGLPSAPPAPALTPARVLLLGVSAVVFGPSLSLPLPSTSTAPVPAAPAVLPPQIALKSDTPPRAPPVCS
jgi:hypothetical protein